MEANDLLDIGAGRIQARADSMCGLAGAILGKKRRRREELRVIAGVFTELLILNQSRGTDASGVAVVRKDGSWTTSLPTMKTRNPSRGRPKPKTY